MKELRYNSVGSHNRKPLININKIIILIVGVSLLTLILVVHLFIIQVIQHDYYEAIASNEQAGSTEVPAQRGEIIIKDHHSGEEFLLATNTTLNLIYADPTLIRDAVYVADVLSPLLFNIEYERATDNERIKEISTRLAPELTQEEIDKLLKPLTDEELKTQFRQNLIQKISEKQRQKILLAEDLEEADKKGIQSLSLTGVEIVENSVYAYPPNIANKNSYAESLATYVKIPPETLAQILVGENRYVVLQRKLQPEVSTEIEKLVKEDKKLKEDSRKLSGLGLKEEYFRFYPEGDLAAEIIGYVNREGIGQYGIESSFNTELTGIAGKFQTKKDSIGRQITVGESILTPAVDGDDVVLTIDRSIQLKVDEILAQAVKDYQADDGQVIVMNPQTGEILAMSHYPTFDPNNYGDVFKKEEITLSSEDMKKLYPTKDPGIYYYYYNDFTTDRYFIFEQKDENGNSHYYRYKNLFGPEVYQNKIVSWPYEPGSAFKPIVMSMAIDDGDVTPNTTYNDTGPVGVDFNVYTQEYDFEIKNSLGYFGLVNMQTVIAKSLNTGMTFVAKKIGPALLYSYLKKFGFLDRTDIELDSEMTGIIEYYEDWTESELATKGFGQGLTITMIQLANAYSALANGGVLMQPHLVEEVRHDDGTVTKNDPQTLRRVISEDTAAKLTKMLVYSAEEGEARQGQVQNHFIAGKTGTSQTYKYGEAITVKGSTIATFGGYGPIDNPQFVIIVKFDRTRTNEWGSATAAPTFSKIAEYLFDYYNIPPDK